MDNASPKSDYDLALKDKVEEETEEEEEEEEEDVEQQKLKSTTTENSRPWSSRFKCYYAYVSSIFCYSALQKNCIVVATYGIFAFVPLALIRIFIGMPAVVIQIFMGRYVMANLSQSWSMHVVARGILFSEIMATVYYIVHALFTTTFLIKYLTLSFSIPWESCRATWATDSCYETQHFQRFLSKCLENNTKEVCMNLNWESSALKYWEYAIANQHNATSTFLTFLYLFCAAAIIFFVIIKGVENAEKGLELFVIVTLVLAPFLTCVICLIREFRIGLKKIFHINIDKLSNMKAWVAAYEATVFTLGIGRLPLAFVSSRAKFEDDIFSDVVVIYFTDIFFCLIITFPTVCVIEYISSTSPMSHSSDEFDIFISLSEMVLLFPKPNHLWGMLYYFLLIVITLGSLSISMLAVVETIINFAPNQFSHFYMSLFLCGFCFFGAVSLFFFDLKFSVHFDGSVIIILFLYLLTLEVFYGSQMFYDDFHFLMGYPVPFFLKLAWIFSLPTSMVMIILNMISSSPPNTANYFFLGIPIFLYIVVACVQAGTHLYYTKNISTLCLPNRKWGLSDSLLLRSRILFDSRAVTKEFIYRQELQEKPFIKPQDISEQAIVQVI